jgi:Uma2 family endonuclease
LIYEIIDGKAIYYKKYQEVINQEKSIEEIMGTSTLQRLIIQYVLKVLFRNLDDQKYLVLTNEAGLHLNKHNNLAADIAIFDQKVLSPKAANHQYALVPPKIQIEVDIKADTERFDSAETYIHLKTQKLLDFGVEKVIWILSSSKKVLIATPNADWQLVDWQQEIEVIDGLRFSVGRYLVEMESPFA